MFYRSRVLGVTLTVNKFGTLGLLPTPRRKRFSINSLLKDQTLLFVHLSRSAFVLHLNLYIIHQHNKKD